MSDFDTGECGGLGTLLKRDPVPNTCVIFGLGSWVKDSSQCPETYFIDFDPVGVDKANISVQEQISVSSWVEVGVHQITYSVNGNFRVDVICDPDCRFIGRVIIDG